MKQTFLDRSDAGNQLSQELIKRQIDNPYILALPRGGVVVASRVASALHAPLNVIITQKITLPSDPEFALGAVSENNTLVVDQSTVDKLNLDISQINNLISTAQDELNRRLDIFRHGQPLPSLSNRTILLVDDGLATGLTAQAAILALRKLESKSIIFAIPVCSSQASYLISPLVDDYICISTPENFAAVGLWYQKFDQVDDQEVIDILNIANKVKDL